MPRRPRLAAGDLAYHVLNRRVGRLPLFEKPADYAPFEQILAAGHAQTKIRGEKKRGRESFLDMTATSSLQDPACHAVHASPPAISPIMF